MTHSISDPPDASQPRVTLTGAEAIVRTLRSAGVREAFGLASGKLAPLFRAIAAEPTWAYMGVRHEASAAFMATAIYAATSRIAVCLGETGPGGLNLLSGLGGASANNLAVLAITSSNPSCLLAPARGAFSSGDNETMFRPIVKWNATIRDVARIPEVIHHALRVALSGRPGPVHLDIATELLAREHEYPLEELEAPEYSYRATSASMPLPSSIAEAAALLASARRPLLVAGGGVVRSGAADAFRRLVERLPALAMTTQMGLGAISPHHDHSLGQGGFVAGPAAVRALREADVVLAVGCRFSSFMWIDGPPRWTDFPNRKLIQIDIDPQALGRNVPLTLGLVGDAKATLQGLVDALPNRKGAQLLEWAHSLLSERARYLQRLAELASSEGEMMHPAALARGVAAYIEADDLVTFDGGHTSFWSNDFTPAEQPGTRFHEPGMAHLGFGLPWAIALARISKRMRSFCIAGDGSFGFTLQELDTARRHQLKVITIIHNNGAWGVIRAGQRKGGFEFGTDLSGTDYAAIARGFGCHGETITRPDEIGPAMERAIATNGPAVIDARVFFDPHPMMPMFGKSTAVR